MRTAGEWSELASLLRRLMPVAHLPTARPLGRDYDVVITEAGPAGDELLCLMDALAGGCGPVIAEAGRPVLCWVVPPGTGDWWDSRYGLCLSAPGSIPFPPLCHERPVGPYWLRPFRADRRVSPEELAAALDAVRPQPRRDADQALAALWSLPDPAAEKKA
ncbi:hypothetical protein ACFQ6U_33155 [Streptomyces sp. NPDC056465]|uniref:hypothetical protein n=1 Tax=Streptomyces sp. NPDC056465 TaxID=3345829 RepID=UPI0036802E07